MAQTRNFLPMIVMVVMFELQGQSNLLWGSPNLSDIKLAVVLLKQEKCGAQVRRICRGHWATGGQSWRS